MVTMFARHISNSTLVSYFLPSGCSFATTDWRLVNSDAICISGILVLYPDGATTVIFGDIPVAYCGWRGFPSITEFSTESNGPGGYRPRCFWMDSDDSYGSSDSHSAKSVNFHLPISKAPTRPSRPSTMTRTCSATAMPVWNSRRGNLNTWRISTHR